MDHATRSIVTSAVEAALAALQRAIDANPFEAERHRLQNALEMIADDPQSGVYDGIFACSAAATECRLACMASAEAQDRAEVAEGRARMAERACTRAYRMLVWPELAWRQ